MSSGTNGRTRRWAAALAASAFSLLALGCNVLIGTEDRVFEGSDATTDFADAPSSDDDSSASHPDPGDADGIGGDDEDAPSATPDSGSDATVDANGGDSAADAHEADGDAAPPACADGGNCPLPFPLVEFHTTDAPITDFDTDGAFGSYLYIAVGNVGLYALKRSDPTTIFLYWTGDGTHTLLDVQATDDTVYMLETDTQANEQFLYSCPSLTGKSPGPCTQSPAIMTLDKAMGMQIVGSEIYWYGVNAAWQATLQQNGTGTSVPTTGATGIDDGAADLYVASINGLYRFPTVNFASSSVHDTNSAVAANSVASDSMNVYGANETTSSIFQLPGSFTSDSLSPTVIAKAQAHPAALQIDGSTLYWLNKGATGTDAALVSCLAPDCNSQAPPIVLQHLNAPLTMRVEADAFYVQDVDTSGAAPRQVIYRLPR